MADDAHSSNAEAPPSMPRWAKVVGIFVIMVLLATGLPLAGIADPADYVRLGSDGLVIGGGHGADDGTGSGDHGGNNSSSGDHDSGEDNSSGGHGSEDDERGH